jgi:hypothetical protein
VEVCQPFEGACCLHHQGDESWLADCLVGDHLLRWNFGPYGTTLTKVSFVISVAMVKLTGLYALRDKLRLCVSTTSDFPVSVDGQFTSVSKSAGRITDRHSW